MTTQQVHNTRRQGRINTEAVSEEYLTPIRTANIIPDYHALYLQEREMRIRGEFLLNVSHMTNFDEFYQYVCDANFQAAEPSVIRAHGTHDFANGKTVSSKDPSEIARGLRLSGINVSDLRGTASALDISVVALDTGAMKDYIHRKLFPALGIHWLGTFIARQVVILRKLREGLAFARSAGNTVFENTHIHPLMILFCDQLIQQTGMTTQRISHVRLTGTVNVHSVTKRNRPCVVNSSISGFGDLGLVHRTESKVIGKTKILKQATLLEVKLNLNQKTTDIERSQQLLQQELVAQMRENLSSTASSRTGSNVDQFVVKSILSDFNIISLAWRIKCPGDDVAKFYIKPRVSSEEAFIVDILFSLSSPDQELIDLLRAGVMCRAIDCRSTKGDEETGDRPPKKRKANGSSSSVVSRKSSIAKPKAGGDSKSKTKKEPAGKSSKNQQTRSTLQPHTQVWTIGGSCYEDDLVQDLRGFEEWLARRQGTKYLSDEALNANRNMDNSQYVLRSY